MHTMLEAIAAALIVVLMVAEMAILGPSVSVARVRASVTQGVRR